MPPLRGPRPLREILDPTLRSVDVFLLSVCLSVNLFGLLNELT